VGTIKKINNMKNRVKEKHLTNEGYTVEIIECFSSQNCTIKFDNGIVVKNNTYQNIKKGQIKNPYHKSVYEVGYFGIGKYSYKTHRKIYDIWSKILQRCYDLKCQEKYPTYKGCLVDEKWHNFQVFAEWYETKCKENFDLDKDILFKGNKIYSSTTCTFVPHEINGILIKKDANRGKYPIGVHKVGSRFKAQININSKKVGLGTFNTIEEAFQAYKIAKEQYIKELAEKYKEEITKQTYEALINYQVEITD
jgi:hypothetical protein